MVAYRSLHRAWRYDNFSFSNCNEIEVHTSLSANTGGASKINFIIIDRRATMISLKSSVKTIMAPDIALSLTGTSASVLAAKGDMEKCYGVVKSGKNDCKTSTNSCVGHAEKYADANAFMVVPKGTCDKIVNGNTKPKA